MGDSECNAAIYGGNQASIDASADKTHSFSSHTSACVQISRLPPPEPCQLCPTTLICSYTHTLLIKTLQSPQFSFSPHSSNKGWPHMPCRPLLIGIQLACWHWPAFQLADTLPAGKEAEALSLICYYTHNRPAFREVSAHTQHPQTHVHSQTSRPVTSGSVHESSLNINFPLLSLIAGFDGYSPHAYHQSQIDPSVADVHYSVGSESLSGVMDS